ncbi:CMT1A duplicated region transcript 15 protein-like protein [Canis lupus baileyi]|uniref:CMT1A duplicated region transcript 15 protein-like protein n=1 Tax=Canis lupus baileyi TaxID=143281 RepID=UPI003B97AB09
MFSCCVPTSRGSGFQKPQGCDFFKCCRLWFHHHTPRLKAFARRRPKSSTQEMGQEWEEEIQCSTSLMNRKVPCTANRGQCGLKGSAGSEVIKTDTAAGVECLPRAKMPGVESKPMHMVVTPLIHCPNVEEPPEPLANLEKEQAQASAIQVPKCLSSHQAQLINQLRPLSNITNHAKSPPQLLLWGLMKPQGMR